MTIEFLAGDNAEQTRLAALEYDAVWHNVRNSLFQVLPSQLRDNLKGKRCKCLVGHFASHSGETHEEPMRLRATYSRQQKTCMMVHELLHRSFFQMGTARIYSDEHHLLCPILYELLSEILGHEAAEDQIRFEGNLSERYMFAWQRFKSQPIETRFSSAKSDLELLRRIQTG